VTLKIECKPRSMKVMKWQPERTKERHAYCWPYNLS